MTSRRGDRNYGRYDDEDDRGDRRERRGDRREPESRTSRADPPKKPRANLNEFFISSEGIHREVLQKEICRFLGPEAYSSPKTYNGVDGYMIKAVRPFTPDMLDDLIKISDRYVSEKEDMRRKGRRGLPYGESETSRRQEVLAGGQQDIEMEDDDDSYDEDRRRPQAPRPPREGRDVYDTRIPRDQRDTRFAPGDPYATIRTNPQSVYGNPVPYASQSQRPDYPSTVYPPGAPLPPQGSSYPPVPGYPAVLRPGDAGSTYEYRSSDISNPGDPYARQPAAYPVLGSRESVRQGPRDDRAYSTSARMEPREVPDAPRYPGYPVSSPGGRDVDMGGYVTAPPSQPGRGGYPSSSRMEPLPYERRSPDLRDSYRREPPREERRRDRRG